MVLSVIIPVYNEAGTILQVLELVRQTPVDKEIVVVDDGSTDGTRELVEKAIADGTGSPLIRLFSLGTNSGKGSAIREGLKHVTGDLVIVQDADLELDPADYPSLIAPLIRGEAEVIYGSRFLRRVDGIPPLIRVFNRTITLFANLLFGCRLTDEAAGYKVFRAELIKSMPLQCRRFEFCPEVTARLLRAGKQILEVPVQYRPRSRAQGKKIRWTDGVEAVWTLLRFRFVRLENNETPSALRPEPVKPPA